MPDVDAEKNLATISVLADTVRVSPGADGVRLRSRGQAATAARRHVLARLRGRGAPASAADLYDDLSAAELRIGLTTVYRVLRLFARHGLVHTFSGPTQRYRLCTPTPHLHLVCERCQEVFKQPFAALREALRGSVISGFEIDPRRTTVYGVCRSCLRSGWVATDRGNIDRTGRRSLPCG
jgi:Fur family transcriptional regulator, ferric uptake regulator